MRIGQGYDVHRLVPDRKLRLGGVDIPYPMGLLGHSDADVLVHVVIESILGACALGDIGKMFPDNDDNYAGANSMDMLQTAYYRASSHGFTVSNLDCTIVAQQPKLAPYIDLMRVNLAGALQVPLDRISIKATTEEGLGFTGTGQAIAAHAVVLMNE